MELNEKLQELRKQRGLTQEELARALYVSRTAVSKWESGRGTPNIDSLKQIAVFFSVSVDELLSGDQLLTIAQQDNKRQEKRYRDLVFGLLDVSTVLFLFLPVFGERAEGTVTAVSLLSLTGVASYLRGLYVAVIVGATLFGILTLALQSLDTALWLRCKQPLSLLLSAIGLLLFIVSPQPYAAALLFVFLSIKVLLLLNKR
ncbi:MAG: helix-turn-helix transcriptional regulator [Clostridia bacterium]|nr:helix-turn-helix transcriptional regulator [Clostridia bacterium]